MASEALRTRAYARARTAAEGGNPFPQLLYTYMRIHVHACAVSRARSAHRKGPVRCAHLFKQAVARCARGCACICRRAGVCVCVYARALQRQREGEQLERWLALWTKRQQCEFFANMATVTNRAELSLRHVATPIRLANFFAVVVSSCQGVRHG